MMASGFKTNADDNNHWGVDSSDLTKLRKKEVDIFA
jgi:hypothetical protein